MSVVTWTKPLLQTHCLHDTSWLQADPSCHGNLRCGGAVQGPTPSSQAQPPRSNHPNTQALVASPRRPALRGLARSSAPKLRAIWQYHRAIGTFLTRISRLASPTQNAHTHPDLLMQLRGRPLGMNMYAAPQLQSHTRSAPRPDGGPVPPARTHGRSRSRGRGATAGRSQATGWFGSCTHTRGPGRPATGATLRRKKGEGGGGCPRAQCVWGITVPLLGRGAHDLRIRLSCGSLRGGLEAPAPGRVCGGTRGACAAGGGTCEWFSEALIANASKRRRKTFLTALLARETDFRIITQPLYYQHIYIHNYFDKHICTYIHNMLARSGQDSATHHGIAPPTIHYVRPSR